MKWIKFILIVFINLQLFSQQPIYFNYVYNPINNYAHGRGIVQVNNSYICLFGCDDFSHTWQSFGLLKLNLLGETVELKLHSLQGHNLYPGFEAPA